MKKIYSIAAAAFVMLSASAQNRVAEFSMPATKGPVLQRSAIRYAEPVQNTPVQRALSLMDYGTEYSWSFYRHAGQIASPQNISIVITDASTGGCLIHDIWDQAPIPAYIDANGGTITIENMTVLKNVDGEDIYFYLKEFDEFHTAVLPGASSAKSVTGTIDANNVVTFPADVIFTVGNPATEKTSGYYIATSQNKFTMKEDESKEGWTTVGDALLQDGWLTPAFGVDQRDPKYIYKVELQQNKQYNTIYRLVDPYRGNFPFAAYNESTVQHGYIEFDIYDPKNVYFNLVDAGFAITDPAISIYTFYCYNLTTFFMQRYGKTPAEVKAEMGNDMRYTTYDPETGILTIPSYYDADMNLVNETMWGDQSQQGSGWEESDGSPVNMETKIFFPGFPSNPDPGSVVGVIGSENAPVRYYNLQGVEVANPSNGIFIRKQGGKVTKEVIR